MTTWSGEVTPDPVGPTAEGGDEPDPISHQTVSVARGIDAQGRSYLQVRMAPDALSDLQESGGEIVVQIVQDEDLG